MEGQSTTWILALINLFPNDTRQMLEDKRIFLTGGTGLLGKWFLEYFLTLKAELVVLSRDPEHFKASFPKFVKYSRVSFSFGDIRSFKFPKGDFDYVIHAAMPVSSDHKLIDSPEMFSIAVDGTKHLLEFGKQANVKRFLYVSSGAIYGKPSDGMSLIAETYPLRPVTAYGRGKLESESLCEASGIESVSARCFSFIGPYMPLNANFAIGNFIGNCLRNEAIEIRGDGTPLRSYMYGADLVEWLLTILVKGEAGRAYNVGSDHAVSILELATLVQEVAGCHQPIVRCKEADTMTPPECYVPSIDLAKKELGLSLTIDLPKSIAMTLRWFCQNDLSYVF